MRGRRGEQGQTTVLIIGFALVLATLVGVVADASAAYLQRQSLNTLADGAALAAAEQVEGATVYAGGLGEQRAPLDTDLIHDAVGAYLAGLGAHTSHPGLRFRVAVRDREVLVRLDAPLDLPITVHGLTEARVGARAAAAVLLDGG